MTEAQLEEIFKEFTKGGDLLDGRGYVKMCKDSKLLDKKFTQVDVDLIFSKAKGVGKTKINLKAWRETLPKLAERKGVSEKAVIDAVLACGGPTFSGTKTESVRWHDDQALYTGVHAHGGPSTAEKSTLELSEFADRSAADIRGLNKKMSSKNLTLGPKQLSLKKV
eukprot:Polyplicarium_translucidae@DN2526_c0_g1_i4.p1